MIDISSVTFGCDAEIFLKDKATDLPFPVCGLVGGTKTKPKETKVGKGYMLQEDNAALEFNIPSFHQIRKFVDGLSGFQGWISEEAIPPSLTLNREEASVVFHDAYLKIPQMQVFGCEPDLNAWKLCENSRPECDNPGLRSAAAHVHVGWHEPTDDDRIALIRLADVFVVLPTIRGQTASEKERRKLYGKAGAFRVKEYGVEHRVLSNRWIFNGYVAHLNLERYVQAISALNGGISVEEEDFEPICKAINEGDADSADTLYKKYLKLFVEKVKRKDLIDDLYRCVYSNGGAKIQNSDARYYYMQLEADYLNLTTLSNSAGTSIRPKGKRISAVLADAIIADAEGGELEPF